MTVLCYSCGSDNTTAMPIVAHVYCVSIDLIGCRCNDCGVVFALLLASKE